MIWSSPSEPAQASTTAVRMQRARRSKALCETQGPVCTLPAGPRVRAVGVQGRAQEKGPGLAPVKSGSLGFAPQEITIRHRSTRLLKPLNFLIRKEGKITDLNWKLFLAAGVTEDKSLLTTTTRGRNTRRNDKEKVPMSSKEMSSAKRSIV